MSRDIERTRKIAEARVKVACINWSSPDAPHALVYLLSADNEMFSETYHGTWAQAVEKASSLASIVRRAATSLQGREVINGR